MRSVGRDGRAVAARIVTLRGYGTELTSMEKYREGNAFDY